MAQVTPTEAIRLSGRSKASFYKDVAAGRVSKSLDSSGKTVFETSELSRVYGVLKSFGTSKDAASETNRDSAELAAALREIELLKQLMSEKDARLTEKDAHIDTLKDAMRLLEYRPSQPVHAETTSEKKAGLLDRLLGR